MNWKRVYKIAATVAVLAVALVLGILEGLDTYVQVLPEAASMYGAMITAIGMSIGQFFSAAVIGALYAWFVYALVIEFIRG